MQYADHEVIKEVDPDAPGGVRVVIRCIYPSCGENGCLAEYATEIMDEDRPEDYTEGLYYLWGNTTEFFGEYDLEVDFVPAELDPDYNAEEVEAGWAAVRAEQEAYRNSYIQFDED